MAQEEKYRQQARNLELTIPGMATDAALAADATREVTLYINECKVGTDFYLTIGLCDASDSKEYRYALIDCKVATPADDDKWDYIARNDYRIIRVTLDGYDFELLPYDFRPIGVYRVSVSEIDNVNDIYDFTFHDYGLFHLLGRLTRSTWTQVRYNLGSGGYLPLSPDWACTWLTAAARVGGWLIAAAMRVNGLQGEERVTGEGEEVGGMRVWYATDVTSGRQWDWSLGTGVTPNSERFVFGYMADGVSSLSTGKKMYHEMKMKLYVGGTYGGDMTQGLYMTLWEEEMVYAGSEGGDGRQHITRRDD